MHLSFVHKKTLGVKEEQVDPDENDILKENFCQLCAIQFGNKAVYGLHLSLVHGKNQEVEEEAIDSGDNMSDQQQDEEEIFKAQTNSLETYILATHDNKKTFKCSVCGYKFSTKQSMNNHIASVHEGKKPFMCSICDYKCS